MKKARLAAQSRSRLDERFEEIGPSARFAPPNRGWIKAIREGLGMSAAQLAKRLKIKQSSVTDMEQSEAKSTIELSTLRRAAAALDCTLIYALVPNKPLEKIVRDRARLFGRQRLASGAHLMQLENQAVDTSQSEAQIDELIRSIKPSQLWNDLGCNVI